MTAALAQAVQPKPKRRKRRKRRKRHAPVRDNRQYGKYLSWPGDSAPETCAFWDDAVDVLKERRYAMKLSLNELNARIGCADGLVASWECGNRRPSAWFFALWCQALGMTLEVHLANENASQPHANNCAIRD